MQSDMTNLRTQKGEKHGIINVLANSSTDTSFKNMKPQLKALCEKQKIEDAKLVKARYLNKNGKHERLTKPYCRWAGDPIVVWHLIPNEVYELPKGLVEEINDPNKREKKRSGLLNSQGVALLTDEYEDPLHMLIPVSF